MSSSDNKVADQTPVRFYMDDPGITWRYGRKPDYSPVDRKYMLERTRSHEADSLEKLVENIVKTWEMEASHKTNPEDWGSVDLDSYEVIMNGIACYDMKKMMELGTYNVSLADCPVYMSRHEDFTSSHKLFKRCFNKGFAWELLDLFSGPPRLSFTWRHWSSFTGKYGNNDPTGELLELFGAAFVTVNADNKIQKLEIYSDPTRMIQALNGSPPTSCSAN